MSSYATCDQGSILDRPLPDERADQDAMKKCVDMAFVNKRNGRVLEWLFEWLFIDQGPHGCLSAFRTNTDGLATGVADEKREDKSLMKRELSFMLRHVVAKELL